MLTKSADLRQWEEVYKHAQVKLISLSRESKYLAEKKKRQDRNESPELR